MIIEHAGLKGIKSELRHLDQVTSQLGFVRWQWEYYRATYDLKIEHGGSDYYLRMNARVTEGKLESPYAVLEITDTYIGKATFPHGLDYESEIPEPVLNKAKQTLDELEKLLS